MASTLQIVDDALTTVLFDLNDVTGVNNAEHGSVMTEVVASADEGSPEFRSTQVGYASADGGTTAFRRAGLSTSEYRIVMKATSLDNLSAGVNRLATLLAKGGVIKRVLQGSAETRYIDYEPSDTPALVGGEELGLWQVIQLFSKPEGVLLSITRQPYLRGPELDSNNNELTNATLCLDRTADTAPDDWPWDVTTSITNASVTAARECFSFDIATTATRNMQQTTPNASLTGGATYTLSGYARASAASIARLELVWQGKNDAGTNQGAEVVSTQTNLTTTWQRVTVSATLNASATKAQVSLRMRNSAATSVRVDFRNVCLEQAATASPFFVGTETADDNPVASKGRVVMFYNPGSAPAHVTIRSEPTTGLFPLRLLAAPLMSGGVVGDGSLTTYANAAYYMQAEAMTLGTDTTLVAGGAGYSGSGSNVASTSFATNTIAVTRLSTSITTNLTCLRGKAWAFLVAVGGEDTGASEFTLGFSYGFDTTVTSFFDSQTVPNADPIVGVANDYILGTLFVPENAAQLNIRLHALRENAANLLRWDLFSLVPLDAFAILGEAGGLTFGNAVNGMQTDPEIPEASVYTVSSGTKEYVAPVRGMVPFVAEPGLTALYLLSQSVDASVTGIGGFSEFGSTTTRFRFSPRYYA